MSQFTYKEILQRAYDCRNSVADNYKLGIPVAWSYYFAKSILNPRKPIKKLNYRKATSPAKGDAISRQIPKESYLKLCQNHIAFIEEKKRMPSYNRYGSFKLNQDLICYALARIVIYQYKNNKLPDYVNVNSKCFNPPLEPYEEIYNYFVKTFGSFGDTIDGALTKIAGKGYGYYYDDMYTNKQSIDRMKKGLGVNCTDSCHVFYNIMKALIKKGKYRKVECLHVQCSGGDGHVRLRITLKDGTKILRDPAAVLSSGDVTYNWCTSGYTLLAVDPSWFVENLRR